MQAGALSANFKTEPYWTEGLEAFVAPATSTDRFIDVAVIGGGFAGLSAALTLARHGCSVTVFEAAGIGDGAAARSAGSLGHVPKASLGELTARYGHNAALAVYCEARQAREYVEALIRDCRIECGLRTSARFIAAHSPRAFARQRDNLESLRVAWGEVRACQTGGAASGDRLRRFLRRHQAAELGYASTGPVAAGLGPRCDWRRRRAAAAGAGAGGAPRGQRL